MKQINETKCLFFEDAKIAKTPGGLIKKRSKLQTTQYQKWNRELGTLAQQQTISPVALARHRGTGSCTGYITSKPAFCYGLGKEWRVAWILGCLYPHWRLGKGGLLASYWLSTSCCRSFGSKPVDNRSLNLSLLSL